jgi:hypothetical protein
MLMWVLVHILSKVIECVSIYNIKVYGEHIRLTII